MVALYRETFFFDSDDVCEEFDFGAGGGNFSVLALKPVATHV
jgi:hypothetical protein